jgi:hypothetical protein
MESKHTPGPWKAEPYLTPGMAEDPMMVYLVEAGNLQRRFDDLEMNEHGEYQQEELDAIHAENDANARLIAQAPAMLKALLNAEWLLNGTVNAGRNTHADDMVLAEIRATIAAATNP